MRSMLSKIFSPYETSGMLDNYIRSQYGPFLDPSFHESESFYQRILAEARSYIDDGTSVLDVGCATGRLVFEYAKLGAKEVWGVDASRRFIGFCEKVLRQKSDFGFPVPADSIIHFMARDILRAGFEKQSFSFISCVNVIDRVPDPQWLIDYLTQILKDDGVILLVDPYDWNLSPAPQKLHVADMKSLFPPALETIKEFRGLQYTVPINNQTTRTYDCHLVIAKKKTL